MTAKSRGYRGSVREVLIETPVASGKVRTERWTFDRSGTALGFSYKSTDGTEGSVDFSVEGGADADVREIVQHSDGSRTEIRRLEPRQNQFYSPAPHLGAPAFPTRDASRVEVTYDPRGYISRAVFLKESGQITSAIEFIVDERGSILEVVQRNGEEPALPLSKRRVEEVRRSPYHSLVEGGGVESRVLYKRDAEGRVLEETHALCEGISTTQIAYTYNDMGDVKTNARRESDSDLAHECRFDYEYDARGNWTRQIITYEGGSREVRRAITYYDD